jgi:hypothetical protein
MTTQTVSKFAAAAGLILTSVLSFVGAPVILAGSTQPGPATVLFDCFDNATLADHEGGALTYVDGPSGFGRAADFTRGNWLQYKVPGWYRSPSAYSPSGKQGTVEMWVYPRKYGISLLNFNWNNKASSPEAGHILHMGIDASGRLAASTWTSISGPSLGSLPTGKTTIPLNRWAHVAFTWGKTGTRLYVNGTLDASIRDNLYPALNSAFFVYVPYWGMPGLGYIDELHILKTAMDYGD